MKTILVLILFLTFAGPARGQEIVDREIALKAKTASSLAGVDGLRVDKATFNASLQRILKAITSSKIWTRYAFAEASSSDIIFKITEDRTAPTEATIRLDVLNPDTNKPIYSEQRDLVDVTNDVHRLLSHFLAEVDRLREENREAMESAARQERLAGHVISRVTCDEVPMFANRATNRKIAMTLHKGDSVGVTMNAGDEDVVKIGEVTGYVSVDCLEDSDQSTQTLALPSKLTGFLVINSNPEQADLFIDGKRMGQTPLQLQLSFGQHNLVLRKVGYKPFATAVSVSASNNNVNALLETK
jgi:hypothetical protein